MDRKRAAALIALSAAVVAVILILLGVGSGPGYTLNARLDDAGQLISGNDVRIGAAKVGTITDVSLNDDGTAELKMSIDGAYAPIPQGTQLAVRSTSLFGIANRFVVLQPPSGPSQPMPDGSELSLAQTKADFGVTTLNTVASAMPIPDSSSACTGTPLRLTTPKRRGA